MFKCLDEETRVTQKAKKNNLKKTYFFFFTYHIPEYLSRAESWSEWDSRQSHALPEFSSPHWAQWNPGCSGRSHRVSPSVPSKASTNTQGDGKPRKHAGIPGQTGKTMGAEGELTFLKTQQNTTDAKFTPASAQLLFWVPSVSLRTKRTSITLSLLASWIDKKS